MGKLLCLDYGEKRVGVAVTDSGAQMAFPRAALFKTTRRDFFVRLGVLLQKEAPSAIVLGLPLRQDGSDSLTTRQVRNFALSLQRAFALPVYFMDETLSSAEAEMLLRESEQKAYMRDGRVDSLAAVKILESFLNLAPEKRLL
ncbi:MAG: Holliday junction resolvase RuvX [Deltaproteobacteria bacterium]|nr:Holliday junction resolvase RuvX [Deltaproteobacteria bacterium]